MPRVVLGAWTPKATTLAPTLVQTRVDSRVATRVVTFGLHWGASRVDSRVASRVASRGQPLKLSTGYAQVVHRRPPGEGVNACRRWWFLPKHKIGEN